VTSFDEARGFAGAFPGQPLDALLALLTVKDLQLIIGSRVLPLLPAESQRDKTSLVNAAVRIISNRPLVIFADPQLRRTLLRNLDSGKQQELRFRIAKAIGSNDEQQIDLDKLTSPKFWPTVSGFFGIDPPDLAQAPKPLPVQSLSPEFGLFDHQRSVVRRAHARIGAGMGRTIIHMPTGAGKTRTAMHLIARILNEHEPCVISWLASSKELLEQASETFESAWHALGSRDTRLVRFWGDYSEAPDQLTDGILVGGLAKVAAWRTRDATSFSQFAARNRLVVIDEAHQAIAPTYRATIEGLAEFGQTNAILGLTATPGRTWNNVDEDERLSEFFGNSKIVLEVDGFSNPVEYLLDNGYLSRPTFVQIAYTEKETDGVKPQQRPDALDDYSSEMLEAFAGVTERNLAILAGVEQLIGRGHTRILLFATSVSHAEDLSAAMSVKGIESYVVFGETPTSSRAAILQTFKATSDRPIVLCNFGVLTTGFDAPSTSAAIIARPTKSLVLFSQMVGRATRGPRAGGNARCEILTVHDPSYPGFGDIAEAFFNWEDVWHDK
jgi:DNA repair protein RadD